jgi:hypothetical protein
MRSREATEDSEANQGPADYEGKTCEFRPQREPGETDPALRIRRFGKTLTNPGQR